MELESLTQTAINAAKLAGDVILSFYKKNISASLKSDGSPLTMADNASHQTILNFLSSTKIPSVSVEDQELNFHEEYYWLVDPLDGTKDFLASNDEFTVNIALIENNRPVLGVLYAPALDELYVGLTGKVTWMEKAGIRTVCQMVPKNTLLKMVTSRFHDHKDAQVFADINQVGECIPIGSALKYGRLAFGKVDIYPRLVGTSEWDTAAGQAVLEAAGGSLLDWHTGQPLRYGKLNRRNGRFITIRAPYKYDDFIYQNFKQESL